MRFRLSRTALRLVFVGAVALAVIACTTAWLISTQHKDALSDGQKAAANFAQVLAEQTSRALLPVELTLRQLAGRLMDDGTLGTGQQLDAALRSTGDGLVDRLQPLAEVSVILVIGADGQVLADTLKVPATRPDLFGRDYYQHFATSDDHGIFVSVPIKGYRTGRWGIALARRVSGPHGEFAGVVAAMVTLAYLGDFYQAAMPAGWVVTVLRRDGTVLLRYPPIETQIGQKLPLGAPWYRLASMGAGSYRSSGDESGPASLVSIHPVRDFPLVIDAAITEADATADWRRQSSWLLVGATIVSALTLLLLRVVGNQMGRLEKSEASLAQRNIQLETGQRQFNAVLENICQGIVFYGNDDELVVCNRRYLEMYRLSPAEVRQGTTVLDIMHMREAAGTAEKMTADAYIRRIRQILYRNESSDVTDELCDGRAIRTHVQPLGTGGWVATHEDVTERRRTEVNLAFLARHDTLTELPNRKLFHERLLEAIDQSRHGSQCVLLCLDLDRFKVVNDTLGHPVGDALLRAVAKRLSTIVREGDTVARLGGDEFAIVQAEVKSLDNAAILADRIISAMREPFELDGHRVVAATSIGIARATSHGTLPETLLKHADIALYIAKKDGRGTFRFFEPEMDAQVQELRLLELELRAALPAEHFELYYQPIVDLQAGSVSGFEALIRWNHPVRGRINPADFIPIAEETGLIVPIGEWVLGAAYQEAAGWPEDVFITVNLSPVQFRDRNLCDAVLNALAASGLPPNRLELEITESVVLQNSADRVALLHQFRALGIRIVLDDFGTGYSSLSYLRSFPFDKIKIDQSFVRDIDTNKDSAVIVNVITGLARGMGMTIVAEGVETPRQLAILQGFGCTNLQGYLFSRPVPAEGVGDLIQKLSTLDILRPMPVTADVRLAAEMDTHV